MYQLLLWIWIWILIWILIWIWIGFGFGLIWVWVGFGFDLDLGLIWIWPPVQLSRYVSLAGCLATSRLAAGASPTGRPRLDQALLAKQRFVAKPR